MEILIDLYSQVCPVCNTIYAPTQGHVCIEHEFTRIVQLLQERIAHLREENRLLYIELAKHERMEGTPAVPGNYELILPVEVVESEDGKLLCNVYSPDKRNDYTTIELENVRGEFVRPISKEEM